MDTKTANTFNGPDVDDAKKKRAQAKAEQEEELPHHEITIDEIYRVFPNAVLLPIQEREKKPHPDLTGWQNTTFEETQTPDYQEDLRRFPNTGVLLGKLSGDLCAVDADSDHYMIDFLDLNPALESFLSQGARGGQCWMYLVGDYPHGVQPLKTKDGKKWGEFRSDGGQSVIRGIHPKGYRYKWLLSDPPPRIAFSTIVWPDYLVLPWLEPEPRPKPEPKPEKINPSKRVILEKRIPIHLPENGILISDYSNALGNILASHDFYLRGYNCVQPIYDAASDTHSLTVMDARRFRTAVEAIVAPYYIAESENGGKFNQTKTMGADLGNVVLGSPWLLEALNPVVAFNSVRLPVVRDNGTVELLPEHYDTASKVLTITKTGLNWSEEKPFSLQEGVQYFNDLLKEFCWREGDAERSKSIVVAGALTLFCRHLFEPEIIRPAILTTGNGPGCGKTLLSKIMMLPVAGLKGARGAPSESDEMEKVIFSKVLGGESVLFMDNLKGHLNSPPLEALITSPMWDGRILGQSKSQSMLHGITVFVTGNDVTVSPDLRRRFLHIDLFMVEARSEDRKIEHNLDDAALLLERGNLLRALWALVEAWNKAGRPEAKTKHPSFFQWSVIIGGILENAGLASPCSPCPSEESGDRETRDFERMLLEMKLKHDYRFGELTEHCKSKGLFAWLIPDYGEMELASKSKFSKLLKHYLNRRFTSGRRLVRSGTEDSRIYYAE
jgi:hypothetical protein